MTVSLSFLSSYVFEKVAHSRIPATELCISKPLHCPWLSWAFPSKSHSSVLLSSPERALPSASSAGPSAHDTHPGIRVAAGEDLSLSHRTHPRGRPFWSGPQARVQSAALPKSGSQVGSWVFLSPGLHDSY